MKSFADFIQLVGISFEVLEACFPAMLSSQFQLKRTETNHLAAGTDWKGRGMNMIESV